MQYATTRWLSGTISAAAEVTVLREAPEPRAVRMNEVDVDDVQVFPSGANGSPLPRSDENAIHVPSGAPAPSAQGAASVPGVGGTPLTARGVGPDGVEHLQRASLVSNRQPPAPEAQGKTPQN